MSLLSRLAVTVLVPLVYVALARWLPLPGTVTDAWLGPGLELSLSPFLLGVMPALSAWLLVELVAAIVPPWAKLRHAGPEARLKLERAVPVVMLVLATFQAFGVALYLEATGMGGGPEWVPNPGWGARVLITLSLAAGACVAYLAARWITRAGLVNGLVLFPLLEIPVAARVTPPGLQTLLRPIDGIWIAAALTLVCAATWLALRSRERVTIPSSSVQPFSAAVALVALPATFTSFAPGFQSQGLTGAQASAWLLLAITLVLGVLFAYLLQRPGYVARVLAIPVDEAQLMFWRSLPGTLALLATLAFAHQVLARRPWGNLSVMMVVVALALIMDFVGSIRAHGTSADLVKIWEERRPYLLPRIHAAFALEKIPLHTLQSRQQLLLRIFAPYVPAGLWVREADAERARSLVERVLAEPASVPEPETPRRRAIALALATAALLGLSLSLIPPARSKRPPGAVAARLEIIRIDDEATPFQEVDENLPQGVALLDEVAPIGPDEVKQVRYVRLVLHDGESEAQALARIGPWVQRWAHPGARIAFGPMEEPDDSGGYRSVGLRSYVLTGDPVVTAANVADAYPVRDPNDGSSSVRIHLDAEGGRRFAEVTRAHVKRRIAIVVDDRVLSAPVVLSEIAGGVLNITLGSEQPDVQYREAERLAAELRPAE